MAEQTGRQTEYRRNRDTWGLRPSFSISSFTVEQVDFCSQCNTQKTFPHVSQSTEQLKMESNNSNFMSPGGKCSLFLTTYKGRGDITWLNKHWGWSIRLIKWYYWTFGQRFNSCTTYGSALEQVLAKKLLKLHLIPGHSVSADWM